MIGGGTDNVSHSAFTVKYQPPLSADIIVAIACTMSFASACGIGAGGLGLGGSLLHPASSMADTMRTDASQEPRGCTFIESLETGRRRDAKRVGFEEV